MTVSCDSLSKRSVEDFSNFWRRSGKRGVAFFRRCDVQEIPPNELFQTAIERVEVNALDPLEDRNFDGNGDDLFSAELVFFNHLSEHRRFSSLNEVSRCLLEKPFRFFHVHRVFSFVCCPMSYNTIKLLKPIARCF